MPEPAESIVLLSNARSQKRVSGAKRLRKLADASAGPALLTALRNEMNDPRTWGPKYEMILALGFVGHRDALPFLWELTRLETEHTIIYFGLGDAIVRLSFSGPTDLRAVLAVMKTKNFSLIDGAFQAMALLRLVPDEDEIAAIIEMARNPEAAEQRQGTPKFKPGLRKWVAVAAAGWPHNKLVLDFLHECEQYSLPDGTFDLAQKLSIRLAEVAARDCLSRFLEPPMPITTTEPLAGDDWLAIMSGADAASEMLGINNYEEPQVVQEAKKSVSPASRTRRRKTNWARREEQWH